MTSSSVAPVLSSRPLATNHAHLSLWEHVSFAITHMTAAWLLACLSLSGFYQIGRAFGTLEWLIDYKRRRRFAAALERVLGRKPTNRERSQATREFFAQPL